jgi:hypothetical protein
MLLVIVTAHLSNFAAYLLLPARLAGQHLVQPRQLLVDMIQVAAAALVMQLKLANGAKLIKLGYSRDPVSRLYHQILKTKETEAQVLRTVLISSGHTAVQIEKGLHARLKAEHPDSVAPPDLYASELRVKSEVYFAAAAQVIFAMLDAIEAEEDS